LFHGTRGSDTFERMLAAQQQRPRGARRLVAMRSTSPDPPNHQCAERIAGEDLPASPIDPRNAGSRCEPRGCISARPLSCGGPGGIRSRHNLVRSEPPSHPR
jgi:hypothetical protein